MNKKSSELFKRSYEITPGGVHSPVRSFAGFDMSPLFFESAQGAYIQSVDGNRYIDFCQSFGPLILGHRDPDVQVEVEKMLNKAWSLGACEPYSLALAEWITNEISWLESVRFVNSGTEAVMSALRLAKGFTGRHKILKFNGCYHGHVDSMLVKSGSGLAGTSNSSSEGVSQNIADETLVAQLDDEENVSTIFKEYGKQIAAVIIEPLPANYGLLPQRKEFIDHVVTTARDCGALVIFDEVISGFRVAIGGMAQVLDIEPDLVTYGKIIGGGFPVGCFGGRKEIMNHVSPMGNVYQAGTLSANPISMAAGLATLKKIKNEQVLETLNERGKKFADKLNDFFKQHDLPWQCVQKASLFWLTLKTQEPIRNFNSIKMDHQKNFNQLFLKLLDENIYLAPAAFEVGFISISHTEEILDEVFLKFTKTIRTLI